VAGRRNDMCLARVYTDEEMEEWLADKPEVIEVWKVAKVSCGAYMAPIRGRNVYESGLNIVEKEIIHALNYSKYWAGFHFFSKPKRYIGGKIDRKYYTCIKCLVKKEWITAIGIEHWKSTRLVIVASQAIFPHYPETEARLEDMDCYPETGPVLVRV
jgi:hypothetical protein